MADSSAPSPRATSNRSTTPQSSKFTEYISSGWAESVEAEVTPRDQAAFAADRRARLSQLYVGKRLIVPAGASKVRANDNDYPFRAHSIFTHLTGWGSDAVPSSVLVMEPTEAGHTATLYFRPAAGRDTSEFYANSDIGEFWTGPRPSLTNVAADLDLETQSLAEFDAVLNLVDSSTLIIRDADRDITDQVDGRRLLTADSEELEHDGDDELSRDLSELRLVKDEYEISEMRTAVNATQQGFDDVISDLPNIIQHARGERLVEGTFNRRARAEGNMVG